jgi:DNA repair exonuclease SbcCD ATPase subunit
LFSYGESNIVDFSKLNGIVGLFAPNATGKSSLLDALSFCLFDTTSRAFKASSILNNKRKKFSCRVNFEINGLNYYITRTGKKLNNEHVKVDVDFYMIDETGEKVSLNGDQRRTTNFNIRRVIGTYEDFILTTLSSQNNSTVFIDKTQKERKELLAQFMGIGVFDKLYTLAHEEIYEVSTLLKDFKKTNYSKELVEIDSEIDSFRIEYDSLIVVKNDLIEEDRQLSKDILEITKKLKPVDDAITDIEQLKIDKHTFKDELQNIEETITEIESKTEVNGLKEDELREKIESYTDDNINKKYLELQQNEQNKSDIKIEIDKLKIDVKHKLDKINTLGNLKYDSNCEYCMSNPFTLDAIKTKNELEVDKKLANEYVDKFDTLENEINHIQHIRDKKFDLDNSLETLQSIESQNLKYISQQTLMLEKKNNTIKQINLLEEKIIKYFTQEKDIKYNKELEDDIEDLKETIDNLVTLISEHEDKINTVHGTIKIGETKKQNIIDTINRVEKLEDKFKAYEYYLDAVKRDGVPYELITKALPTIEGEVNNILSQIVDFGIILEMDGKNINTHLVYDNDNLWPLELSSGMERFISSLAIRVGLINVSNLPRSNFLAIDEGWGTMDSDNLNSVYQLFQYLKSQFQFTLIVSHIDTMRDAVDSLVEITKYKNYSSIKYV